MEKEAKIAQLETTLKDKAMMWYMKYKSTTSAVQARSLKEIKRYLLREFQRPKSESQCITKVKDINKLVVETSWDYHQWFNIFLDRLTFQLQEIQHREWFIVRLLPHIPVPLTQQKVTNQAEDVEISMRLEATPGGSETSIGMVQVQY